MNEYLRVYIEIIRYLIFNTSIYRVEKVFISINFDKLIYQNDLYKTTDEVYENTDKIFDVFIKSFCNCSNILASNCVYKNEKPNSRYKLEY